MTGNLNNATTANDYSATVQTMPAVQGVRINIQVNNASVFWRWTPPGYNALDWQNEEFLLPGKYSFDRAVGAAQFRSGAAGVPAQVTATVVTGVAISG